MRVLDSGAYILGPEGRAFEAEFAAAHKAKRCVGLNSGTDALELALKAVGVGPGDDVVVPTFSFIATATAVSAVGANPVFADVNDASLTLGDKELEAALTPRTKAVMPVHIYGYPADMDGILKVAKRRGLKVIEDCAQSHLTTYKGRFVGTLGDIGAFSFYPSKNLGAAGDAGAVLTNDDALAEACVLLRNAGRGMTGAVYTHVRVGHNCRLDDLQAAVLRVKLKRLAAWTQKRRQLAALYQKLLKGLPLRLPPADTAKTKGSHHLFVVRTPRRDELQKHLLAAGIGSGVYYPIPIHKQPAYAAEIALPVAERAAAEVLALPMFPELTKTQVELVARSIRAWHESSS